MGWEGRGTLELFPRTLATHVKFMLLLLVLFINYIIKFYRENPFFITSSLLPSSLLHASRGGMFVLPGGAAFVGPSRPK